MQHDLLVAQGSIPTKNKRVPLSDCAGEIVSVGSDVKQWNVGDNVMSVCFPHWTHGQKQLAFLPFCLRSHTTLTLSCHNKGPPQQKLLSFIGDNEDGYGSGWVGVDVFVCAQAAPHR
jgi:NADPH:quinone reductase-like Zn-dependent oxidoreductase